MVNSGASPRELSPAERDILRAIRDLATHGELPRAAGDARAALARGLRHPFLFNVIAMELEGAGKLREAVQTLDEALDEFADDLACRQARGLCLLRLERPEEAREDFERVVALKPDFAPGFTALGQAFEASGLLPAAESRYRRALALDATNIMAESGLASVLGRRGDHDEARERALRVLAAEPNYPPAAMVVAEADIAQKRFADAATRMRALEQDPRVSDVERSLALSVLGDALDREGDAAAAFAAYSESNRLRRAHYAPAYAGAQGTLAYAQSLLQWFRQHPARDLLAVLPPEVSESPAIGHAFLIGFPRSGTTLLEQVLACHPRVVALEERDTLRDSVSAFMKSPADLARLGLATEEDLVPYRRLYWQRVAEASVTANGKVFVDKHPLNGLKLPLIARLFPEARILLAIRDPRDVVLSCFRRRFRMSAPYFEMLTLQSAAAFYDCVMEITHELIAQLQLRAHVVQLERLIERFDNEVGGVCTFLELAWSDRMREFAEGARARGVATASGAQISRGLNAGGVGEWRRYRAQLAPVLPTLNKWAARFGYETD
jgi:tetratricopeptide (TPR) repeat protein